MKRTFIQVSIVLLLVTVLGTPAVLAQDEKPADTQSKIADITGGKAAEAQVTQAELAQIMVDVLNLYRFLPASPTPLECFAVLLENGISPQKGWETDTVVTRADLARVIVQALGRQNEVENPDDPRSWINFLKSQGVSIGTVGEAVDNLEPLPEPVAPNVFKGSARVDPLVRRTVFGEPDEEQFGTDVDYVSTHTPVTVAQVEYVIQVVPAPPAPQPPVTPN